MLNPGLLGDSVQGLGADWSMGLEQMGKETEPFGVKGVYSLSLGGP